MFSVKEKQYIAREVEKLLLGLNHPEMPKENAGFTLMVVGKEGWSFAEIKPNWTFTVDNPPKVNPFNEVARDILDEPK
jgi:hypothetical protein